MAPEQTPDVGRFIREQRRLAELSVRRLAELSGVSNPYLSQIERGLRRPSADILSNIAKALQISAESLYVRAGILERDTQQGDAAESGLGTAIRQASELTPDQRNALIGVYQSFMSVNERGVAAKHEGGDSAADVVDELD